MFSFRDYIFGECELQKFEIPAKNNRFGYLKVCEIFAARCASDPLETLTKS